MVRTSFALTTFFVVAFLVFLATTTTTDAIAPVKHSHLTKPDRKKWCGTDSDCVIVKEHGAGGVIRIDGLDLMEDTADTLREKLPPWFGPRPCKFVHDHDMITEGKPLAQHGVELMSSIIIYPANEHQKDELERLKAEKDAEEKKEEEEEEEEEEATAEEGKQ